MKKSPSLVVPLLFKTIIGGALKKRKFNAKQNQASCFSRARLELEQKINRSSNWNVQQLNQQKQS